MKKAMFKLIVICIGFIYIITPGNVEKIKSKARQIINKPIVELKLQFENFMRF